MKNLNKWAAWMGAGAIMLSLAGCADRNDNGQPDSVATNDEIASTTKEGVDNVDAGADKMGNAMANTGNALAKGADTAVDKTGNALANTGNALAKGADKMGDAVTGAGAAAVLTPKIKTAIGAAAALKGSRIDVDTNGNTKTITLKGTITSAAQKNLASNIAKQNAQGYKIVNNLTMGGKMAGNKM